MAQWGSGRAGVGIAVFTFEPLIQLSKSLIDFGIPAIDQIAFAGFRRRRRSISNV
jgi:hypothetical protein